MTEMIINPPHSRDKAGWQGLFKNYARFYRVPLRAEAADRVWKWLTDPHHELEALIARTPDGEYMGFVHFRAMPQTVTGTTACHLDDVFVAKPQRGTGVADALIYAVSAIGRRRGWSSVRWVVAEDNYRARAVFDRHGKRARGVLYEIDLSGPGLPKALSRVLPSEAPNEMMLNPDAHALASPQASAEDTAIDPSLLATAAGTIDQNALPEQPIEASPPPDVPSFLRGEAEQEDKSPLPANELSDTGGRKDQP